MIVLDRPGALRFPAGSFLRVLHMIERFDVAQVSYNPVFNAFRKDHLDCYALAQRMLGRRDLIMDCASGLGHGYTFLCDLGTYVGLDISEEAITRATRRNPSALYLHRDLDAPECFGICRPDAIVSIYTMEHLYRPENFIRSAFTALRPGGKFVAAVPTSLSMDFDPFHRHDWPEQKWTGLLEAAGFEILSRKDMSISGSFRDFSRMTPTTFRQKLRIAAFIGVHPRYLADRLWNWLVRGRFTLRSALWECRKSDD